MLVPIDLLLQPVFEFLNGGGFQVHSENPVVSASGVVTSTDLHVTTPTGKKRTLNVGRGFTTRRTPEAIKNYCEQTGIASQLENADVSIAIADVL